MRICNFCCTFADAKVVIMKGKSGIWIIVVAALALEAISCIMYFTSRHAIRQEAQDLARAELRKAELEIELRTIELETAAKTLAKLAEKSLDDPDAIYPATRLAVSTLRSNTSLAVAFVPDYFPKKGRYYEICSSRISEDSIFTRNIGSAEHDYTQMEWFQNGLVIDSCWWSEPYLDDSGSQEMVVSCSCPVHDKNGKVVAVVCVDLSLEYLKDLSANLEIYPNSYSSIRSSKGENIVSDVDTTAGDKYNIFHQEIGATGWHIEVIIPDDELFRSLNRIGRIVGLLMILGLGVLIFIVWHSSRNLHRLLESKALNQRMEDELEVAQTIQMAMLPKVFPPFLDRLDLNIYGIVHPAKEVGGDLYDFYVRHDKLFFCVGDVSGKGVPASLVMATIRSLFRNVTAHEERAAEIVKQMNDSLAEQNEQNMFVTLFLGVLDTSNGELDYCNAGHNAPVCMPYSDVTPRLLPVKPNLPLGVARDYDYVAQKTKLHYNDTLFLYTDGLTEAENAHHDLFGDERMFVALEKMNTLSPRKIVDNMRAEIQAFVKDAEQSDDITMLALRYQIPALVMRNDIQQIPTLAEWIDELKLPEELTMPVNLALEEAVSNVMLYAYPDTNNGKVFVEFVRSCTPEGEQLTFTISDSGIPFDPTQKSEPDLSLPAEERAIGGLGIHLVRQLMDEVQYVREDDKNVLTLVKKLKSEN